MKKYFQTITLFTVLAFFLLTSLIIVAISRQPEELKSDFLFTILKALLAITALDVVMKLVFKLKKTWLLILQVLILLTAVYIWIISE